MLGGRKGSTPLSYNLQPQAQYVFDPITRRAVRYVETIVPTVNLGDSQTLALLPADRYYVHVGASNSTSGFPAWAGSANSVVLNNYDATEDQFYARFSDGVGTPSLRNSADIRLFYPTGAFGEASTFAPKNTSVTKVVASFKARFNANADYTTTGIGFSEGAAGTVPNSAFNTSGNRFVQLLRNAGNWEMGSCDGTTISQSSVSGADGSWHEFRIEWDTELRLYVDDVLVLTKTTNLPDRPLAFVAVATGTTNTFDLVDVLVRWE